MEGKLTEEITVLDGKLTGVITQLKGEITLTLSMLGVLLAGYALVGPQSVFRLIARQSETKALQEIGVRR